MVVTDGLSPLNEKRLGHVPSHLPQWGSVAASVLLRSSVLPFSLYAPHSSLLFLSPHYTLVVRKSVPSQRGCRLNRCSCQLSFTDTKPLRLLKMFLEIKYIKSQREHLQLKITPLGFLHLIKKTTEAGFVCAGDTLFLSSFCHSRGRVIERFRVGGSS